MRHLFLRVIPTALLFAVVFPAVMQAQSDPAKIFSTNCVLCHSANGSGDSATGKALHAKDLRSEEVQKQSDKALTRPSRFN